MEYMDIDNYESKPRIETEEASPSMKPKQNKHVLEQPFCNGKIKCREIRAHFKETKQLMAEYNPNVVCWQETVQKESDTLHFKGKKLQ